MELTADRRALADAARWVALATQQNATDAPQVAVHIETVEPTVVRLTAHDYDTVHSAEVTALVDEEGQADVHAGLFRDLLLALRGDDVSLKTEGSSVTLRAGRSTHSLRRVGNWREPVQPSDMVERGTVDAEELRRAVAAVAFAADDDYPSSKARGMRLEGDVGKTKGCAFRAVALQSSCAGIASIKWRNGHAFAVQLPYRAVSEAVRGLSGDVRVSVGQSLVRFTTDAREVTLRLYQGEPAPWRQIVPEPGAQIVTADAELLLAGVRRAALTLEPDEVIRVAVEHGEATISHTDNSVGSGTEFVDVAGDGEFVGTWAPELLAGALTAHGPGDVTLSHGAAGNGSALTLTDKARSLQLLVMSKGRNR